jgi:transmembrane sensor
LLGTATRRRVVIAAAVVAAIAVIGNLVSSVHGGDVYRTQPGERRLVTLADGSRVQLDSSTELRVRFSARQRELSLTQGQARFDVAHDFQRPFSVAANGRTVVATGTAFNVDVLGEDLLVTLIEGRVVVLPNQTAVLPRVVSRSSDEGPPAAGVSPGGCDGSLAGGRAATRRARSGTGIELKAGELLVVSAGGCTSIVQANVERATAWESGQLILENETLRSVVERVNRYSREVVVIADERVADLRISGVFRTDDVAGLVETLTLYLPIDADESDGSIRLSHR